jgi:hypothetical protein
MSTLAVLLFAGACALGACKTNEVSATTTNSSNAIGPTGGTAQGANGEELIVPGGALSTTVAFSLTEASVGTYPALPTGLSSAGPVFEFTPHGTQFATPATVRVPYTTMPPSPSDLVLLQAEEGASSWAPIPITATISSPESAVEGAVSTLSYFTVAYSSSSDAGQAASCSGRAAVANAPTGTIMSFTGTYTDSGQTIDLSQIQDGYATAYTSGAPFFVITFTGYANACGYIQNDDFKVGGTQLILGIQTSSAPAVQTYPASATNFKVGGEPADAGLGTCTPESSAFAGAEATGTGVMINAIDSSHVQGSFSYTPSGGSTISGTFDVPFCAQGAVTPECCIP